MYSFREIEFNDGSKELVIDFADKSKDILSIFLTTEVEEDGDIVISYINKVINKESEYEEFVGNVSCLEITAETTKVSDIFDMNIPCEIDTKELKALIDMWLKKLNEFREING